MTTRNIVPREDNEGKLGTGEKRWLEVNTNSVYANNTVLTFNNVEEMKASDKVKDGYALKTLGFYAVGDGGGASYLVIKDIGEDEVDEASIITLQKKLYAKLLVKDCGNVKQFGAKGDGETDDTEALQKTINYAIKNSKVCKLQTGDYLVTDTLLINATRITMIGESYAGLTGGICLLKSKIKNGKNVIEINNKHEELDGAVFKNFGIVGNGEEGHGLTCLAGTHRNNIYRDIRVYGVGQDGIHFEGEGYMESFYNTFGDHCKGWGHCFIGGQDWAGGNKKTLGQCSLMDIKNEFNALGSIKIENGLDVKFFGGQDNGLIVDGSGDTDHNIYLNNVWGCTFYAPCVEHGKNGVTVEGLSVNINFFGGRIFNQTGDYSIKFNQAIDSGSIHGGCGVWGTMVDLPIYINNKNFGTRIDCMYVNNNPADVKIEDNGYMTEIAPRILATKYADKYLDPKFGVTNIKLANLNNTQEHLLIEQKDGIVEFGYNTEKGDATYQFKVRHGISILNSSFSEPPIQIGEYRLWIDTQGRLRIKNGAPLSDEDGVAVGAQN